MKLNKILAMFLAGILMISLSAPMVAAEETIKIGGISVLTGPES